MTRTSWRGWTILVAVATAAAASLGTGGATNEAEEAAARGSVTYRVYCASCHGRSAKGDGKLASSLRVKPADLTQIARRNDGVFDAAKVAAYVDGREEVAAHGERDMPVWGVVFGEGGDNPEADAKAKLADLVAYLKTLQAPAEKKGGS